MTKKRIAIYGATGLIGLITALYLIAMTYFAQWPYSREDTLELLANYDANREKVLKMLINNERFGATDSVEFLCEFVRWGISHKEQFEDAISRVPIKDRKRIIEELAFCICDCTMIEECAPLFRNGSEMIDRIRKKAIEFKNRGDETRKSLSASQKNH